ncbi:MAG: EAL domain-containing protein [Hyphomonadaceae bacterium]
MTPQAVWSDAVIHLQDFDRTWAEQNIGNFLTNSNGFQFAGVVDRDGHLAYLHGETEGVEQSVVGREIAPLIAAVRAKEKAAPPLAERVKSGKVLSAPINAFGIIRLANRNILATVSLVQPDFDPAIAKPGPAPMVMAGLDIDQNFLDGLSYHYLLNSLTLAPPVKRESATYSEATFHDIDGKPAFTLRWKPRTPGSDVFWSALPFVLTGIGLLGAAVFLLEIRTRRTTQRLIASERRSAHMAHHDALTGLPNRTLTIDRLSRAIEEVKRGGSSFAIHCIDLDRFKEINDTFGHHVGDELIRQVTALVSKEVRAVDTFARLGGDEFAVIQRDCTPVTAAKLADRIVKLMAQPIDLSAGRVYSGCSIGIKMITEETARDPQEALRKADLALYRAKDGGRGGFVFFEKEMDAAIQMRRTMQNQLREALANNELFLVYQPQVDEHDRVTGVEALMRWVSPCNGSVPPSTFIPLAEECGLIDEIGWLALRQAFTDGNRWPGLKVGVNVSAAQLRNKSFVADLRALLTETGANPHHFELEITEGLLLSDTPETQQVLQQLQDMGFSIALDDFGTGYSSLSYLQRFPIDRIKIDRSFVSNLGTDAEAEDVIAAIVRLARALGMAVVAEGVETGAQRDRLAAAGCNHIQGYLTSRPLGVDDIAPFIATHQKKAA